MANIPEVELKKNNYSTNAMEAAKNIATKMGDALQRRPTVLV